MEPELGSRKQEKRSLLYQPEFKHQNSDAQVIRFLNFAVSWHLTFYCLQFRFK